MGIVDNGGVGRGDGPGYGYGAISGTVDKGHRCRGCDWVRPVRTSLGQLAPTHFRFVGSEGRPLVVVVQYFLLVALHLDSQPLAVFLSSPSPLKLLLVFPAAIVSVMGINLALLIQWSFPMVASSRGLN